MIYRVNWDAISEKQKGNWANKLSYGLYFIYPEHIFDNYGQDATTLRGNRSHALYPGSDWWYAPMNWFTPFDCSEVWESL